MDGDSLKSCIKFVRDQGNAMIGESRAAYQARVHAEEQAQAEREKIYRDADNNLAILTFDHWLDNSYYSGEFAGDTYPVIKRIACEVFERGVYEVILRGSIGFGKTWLTQLIQKYCLYYLTTFVVPQKAFTRKLASTSPIVMINMNITETKARSSYFSTFRRSILSTGYFQDKCVLKKNLINRVEFTDKSILCYPTGASKHAAESENLIFVALDEINLYENVEKSKRSDSGDNYDEAEVVDSAATHRQESRFINPDGTFPLPVKKVLLCKETYPNSYIARRAREIKEKNLDRVDGNGCQHSMVVHLAEWESKPKHYYIVKTVPENDQWFWICTSTRTMPARVVTDKRRASDERKRIQTLKEEGADVDLIPELIRVPTMGGKYVDKAKINIEDFIRDICGRPTEAIDMYLKDRTLLTKAKGLRTPGNPYPWFRGREQDAGAADRIQQVSTIHPFTAEATDLNDGVLLIRDRLVRQVLEVGAAGEEYVREEPLVAPGAPRFLHLDMGLSNDAAGLAMVAVPGMKDVSRWDDEKDESAIAQAPWLWPDFLMRFVPPEQGQIRFSAIKSLVRELRRMGFKIVGASADGYQSADFLQWADEQLGAETELISLDRTPEGYLELLRALTEGRLVMYEQTLFEEEVRSLERKLTKRSVAGKAIRFEYIDHTPHSQKDISDGLAGAVLHATRKAAQYSLRPSAPMPIKPETFTPVQEMHERGRGVQEAMRDGNLERVFDLTGGYNGDW